MKKHLLVLACLALSGCNMADFFSTAKRQEPWNAAQEQASFQLAEGFTIELVASEEHGLVNPIDITFDDAGRLWTQTASMYPLDPVSDVAWNELLDLMSDPEAQAANPDFQRVRDLYQGRSRGEDKILVIDSPHDKQNRQVRTWADGLAIPQSVLPYKDGVYVAQGSEVFLLRDTDGDGRADTREPLLTGFGVTDTHTMAHSFVRAPGGWIHFSHGALNKGNVTSMVSGREQCVEYSKILRMPMDGSDLQVIGSGLNNIWGFQLRADGQWYATEANDLGWSVVPMEPGTGFEGIGGSKIRPYQPLMPELHSFRVGGTGISGLAFSEDTEGSFPEAWQGLAFLANPITNSINTVKINRRADGSVAAEHLPDLLTAQDRWFRPVNLEFGPDGCLYVADWYNKIISHNEVETSHPDRDKSHGRIWRICSKQADPRSIPNLLEATGGELLDSLHSPSLWQKRAAWRQIIDRGLLELVPQLREIVASTDNDSITRIHALWSLEGLGIYDAELMVAILGSDEDALRREAVRALSSFKLSADALAAHLAPLVADENALVRAELLRTLLQAPSASNRSIDILVSLSRPELRGNEMGGAYERHFERYLARMALEQHPLALMQYLESPAARRQPESHLLWASQAVPAGERGDLFLQLWPRVSQSPLDTANFLLIAELLEDPRVRQAVSPYFTETVNAVVVATLARDSRARLDTGQARQMALLLTEAVASLITSDQSQEVILGLEVADSYRVPGSVKALEQALSAREFSEVELLSALPLLTQNPGQGDARLQKILAKPDLSWKLQLATFSTMAALGSEALTPHLQLSLTKLSTAQRAQLVTELAQTPKGQGILLSLYSEGDLQAEDFSTSDAQRIVHSHASQDSARQLDAAIKQRLAHEEQQQEAQLAQMQQLLAQRGGESARGEPLFTALCLSCHTVAGQGAGFAPALDGSGFRDDEGLLTAILQPDKAIESGYVMYQVTRQDGRVLEGYLKQSSDSGVILVFMGGAEVFIGSADIASQRYLWGRSVMPAKLLNGLQPEQLEDLFAYIRSLK